MAKDFKYEYTCISCGTSRVTYKYNQKLCSNICRKKYYTKYVVTLKSENLAAGTVGAITELKVATFLMEKGYAIFRALSQACFCDLIAIKNDEIMYLEVRTGNLLASGKSSYPKKLHTNGGIPTHYAVYTRANDNIEIIKIQ